MSRPSFYLDDLLHLLEHGVSPAEVCDRLDATPGAIAARLRRHGMPVQARPFARLNERAGRAHITVRKEN